VVGHILVLPVLPVPVPVPVPGTDTGMIAASTVGLPGTILQVPSMQVPGTWYYVVVVPGTNYSTVPGRNHTRYIPGVLDACVAHCTRAIRKKPDCDQSHEVFVGY